MIQKWKTDDIQPAGDFKIFSLSRVQRSLGEKTGEFVVINSPNWVNIIPITHGGNLVMVEQYRHGTDSITLELPGGLMDKGENPEDAVRRECLEETGYGGDELVYIGEQLPNPAFMNNTCYTYAWLGCRKISEQNLDRTEDILVKEVPLWDIMRLLSEGKINHSIIMSALFLYFLKYPLK